MSLKSIAESLKRVFTNHSSREVKLGWRNESGQRTRDGIHAFINFLQDDKFSKEWEKYVLDRYKAESSEDQEDPLLSA